MDSGKRVLVAALCACALVPGNAATLPAFTEISVSAGVAMVHQSTQTVTDIGNASSNVITPVPGLPSGVQLESSWLTGGVAAGDYDGDGWPDLFVVGGDAGQSRLFRNNRDGTFSDRTLETGLDVLSGRIAGATFADYDGDGDLDLFVGGALSSRPWLLRNDPSGTGGRVFVDRFEAAFPGYREDLAPNAWGAAFGDINGDACLDVYIPHSLMPAGPSPAWKTPDGSLQHLWRNQCDGSFVDISVSSGISGLYDPATFPAGGRDNTFAGNFADLDRDGRPDLVVTGDIGTSLVLMNQGDETFVDVTDRNVVNGTSAMGAGIGDVNNDGGVDWFSSQIGMPSSGNRLYLGDGNGGLSNVTAASGVREGNWGWGACIGDFNNDGYEDIFHVNGFYHRGNDNPDAQAGRYSDTPAVLFVSNGDGTFSESAASAGIDDRNEGRGVSCFDFDRDGDLDIAISNYKGPFRLYQNDMPAGSSYLGVTLRGDAPNLRAIGARIVVQPASDAAPGPALLSRTIQVANHFVSSSPAVAHFGLGDWTPPVVLRVDWPAGHYSIVEVDEVDRYIEIDIGSAIIHADDFEASGP